MFGNLNIYLDYANINIRKNQASAGKKWVLLFVMLAFYQKVQKYCNNNIYNLIRSFPTLTSISIAYKNHRINDYFMQTPR